MIAQPVIVLADGEIAEMDANVTPTDHGLDVAVANYKVLEIDHYLVAPEAVAAFWRGEQVPATVGTDTAQIALS